MMVGRVWTPVMRGAHGGKQTWEKKKKKRVWTRGGERRRKRGVAQQVVHTARWVPGAWRGWLRYQTAHTRGGGQNISSEHRNQEKGKTEKESRIWRRMSQLIFCIIFLSMKRPKPTMCSSCLSTHTCVIITRQRHRLYGNYHKMWFLVILILNGCLYVDRRKQSRDRKSFKLLILKK